ncbi:GNAT family N-acetyltransferase (plasmid) [Clostridium estertheticum]|uniref:GNAT family N-acetyltransferase n=1 Tax=Clostridium estertheticum TaxID=238834 RepID=UPI001C0CAB37|nr:GNAT family N-acetyltransferase [Clostridium estertheticum]MBU3202306.1 GNAT family N-acetyltransferase [Clostridium estertheticum]WAG68165.1 GNAT family N-acetyltransferase [Clostridium estertheticum]
MQNINLINGYKIKSISVDNHNIVDKLCMKCSDYYRLHDGLLPSKEEVINGLFTDLPPNKDYEDKFVLGIYKFNNELVGIIDIVRDFPIIGQWMLGLVLIEPNERGTGLGRIIHEALVEWAINLGATSFRIGVIEENHMGINFWSTLGYTKIKEVNVQFTEKTHTVDVMTLQFCN